MSGPVTLRRGRAPLLAAAVLAMLAGLWGGLGRLGLPVAAPLPLSNGHGLLMAVGFLGTVIALERAVALARPLAYAAPALGTLAALALLAGAPFAPLLLAAAGAAFAAVSLFMWRRRPELATGTMAAGAIAWIVAAVLLAAGSGIPLVVPLLAAFLVLTVVGERLELSKVTRPPSWAVASFAVACAVLVVAAIGVTATPDAARVAGLALLALAAWLARWDVARRTVHGAGVTRYIAVALLLGYAWLAVGGMTWIVAGARPAGFAYDAFVHTVFVGFVLSMVFAHEPVVVPALLGVALPFSRLFYVPLALLHASLAARIAGDAASRVELWRWAGVTNVVAVLLFAAVTLASARGLVPLGRRDRAR